MDERGEPHEKTLPVDRRRVLGLGGAVAGLAAAKILGGAEAAGAADGDPVVLGKTNVADGPTVIESTESGSSLEILGSGSPLRIRMTEGSVEAVSGYDSRTPPSVTGTAAFIGISEHASGVLGASGDAFLPGVKAGVVGTGDVGVAGTSGVFMPPPVSVTAGTYGIAARGFGVLGCAGVFMNPPNVTGMAGVFGVAADSDVAGVQAVNLGDGIALDVVGRARFSSVGKATLLVGSSKVLVPFPSISADSAVIVTLNGDPGPISVHWAEVLASVGFVLHVKPRASRDMTFCYLVVEGPSSDSL